MGASQRSILRDMARKVVQMKAEMAKAKMGRSKDDHRDLGSMTRVAKRMQKTMIMLRRKWMKKVLGRLMKMIQFRIT